MTIQKIAFNKLYYRIVQWLRWLNKANLKLIILFIILNLNIFCLASVKQANIIDPALDAFIQLISAPTIIPPNVEILSRLLQPKETLDQYKNNQSNANQSNSVYTSTIAEDQNLKTKVTESSQKILNSILTCLPDRSESHRALKSHLKLISKELNLIKVYSLPKDSKYSISTQYRFGAINLPNYSILFNLKYPTWDDKFNLPFYFHEALEALNYEDRHYQLTGVLWTLHQKCVGLKHINDNSHRYRESNTIKSINYSSTQIFQSETIALIINKLLNKPLSYNEQLLAQNDQYYDSIILSDGGGTTGIGSGGDPTAAYFMASLYHNSLNSIHNLEIWNKLINTRVEAIPGSSFFWSCLKTNDIKSDPCKKEHFQKASDTKMKWTLRLLDAHLALKDKSENSYNYFYKYFSLLMKNHDDENQLLLILDSQLLHWYYSNFNLSEERIFPEWIILENLGSP